MAVTFPPLVAVVWAIAVTEAVVTLGNTGAVSVVNVISLPYAVPVLFVAYDLT
jgi:hypothetical protein